MIVRIAVLSDLHCRDSQSGIKTTYLCSDLLKTPISRHPIEALKKKISEIKLTSDYLICLGDITDKINQQGLISGWGYINEIASALGINANKLVVTPGNHDVDSHCITPHPTFNHFIIGLNNVIPINDIDFCNKFWGQHFMIKEFENIIILAYNTVHNHTNLNNALKTDIDPITLESLEVELTRYANTLKPKIALCHHHPIKLSNFDIVYKDGDSIENGEQFLDILNKHKFNLFIHGHKHIPHLEYRNSLPIFCSGSFSSLENVAILSKRNTFHIIELKYDNLDSCNGIIETYEFVLGRGWSKNTDSEGFFPWRTGFGYLMDMEQLSQKVILWFNEQNREILHFDAVIENFIELNYLTPYQQIELENNLLRLGKIKIIPSLKTDPQLITKVYTK